MAIIRKTNFAFPLGVRVVEGWLVRAACRVGDGRVVELFTALQIDIAVSEPFAEFLMKTYVANERRVFSSYIYERPLTDICTVSQSDTFIYICMRDGWAIFNSNTQKDDVKLRVPI